MTLKPALEIPRVASLRTERLRPALRVHRVLELMVVHLNSVRGKDLCIQIAARAAEAGEQRARAQRLADVQDQVGARAVDRELRAAREARAHAERVAQEIERRLVEVDQPVPARVEDAL